MGGEREGWAGGVVGWWREERVGRRSYGWVERGKGGQEELWVGGERKGWVGGVMGGWRERRVGRRSYGWVERGKGG